jgi:hypothetical protein
MVAILGGEDEMISIYYGTPWYLTFITALAGVIVGGFITFFITQAKTRSEMKWELKREAYKAILDDIDQAKAVNPTNSQLMKTRRAKHLMKLAYGQSDISTVANKILASGSIPEKQKIIDDEFMPKLEADLEETIKDWWKIWK